MEKKSQNILRTQEIFLLKNFTLYTTCFMLNVIVKIDEYHNSDILVMNGLKKNV